MMYVIKRLSLLLTSMLIATGLIITPAAASTDNGRCWGPSCNGIDPAKFCAEDAITVAAQAMKWGMLELRYSERCAANRARYTTYRRSAMYFLYKEWSNWPRVTIWNPGGSSYGNVNLPNTDWPMSEFWGTAWTAMTDGTIKACTGVEVILHLDSEGWEWGPCY